MTLHSPWFLLLLLLAPVIWRRWGDRRGRGAVLFSEVAGLKAAGPGGGRRRLLPALRTGAFVFLVVALARPQKGDEEMRIESEGVAIQLVCDVSGSMNALDFEVNGEPTDRISVVKQVMKDFVKGDGKALAGRPDDLIGLITFARYADSVCPLTLDHENLVRMIEGVRAQNDLESQRRALELADEYRARQRAGASEGELREIEAAYRLLTEEDGTAIGDAIGLGLERLEQATRARGGGDRSEDSPSRIKSRVLILMTDGKQNIEDSLDPVAAARLARPLGVKIHAISVGRANNVFVKRLNPVTRQAEYLRAMFEVDEAVLERVAEVGGGRFFRATDTKSLQEIYREIDQMERSRTDEKRYMHYTEEAWPWLLAAFACLAAELGLGATVLRKIP